MKHLKSYSQHNEGIGSSLLKAGLAGSLLFNSPEVKSQPNNPVTTLSKDTSGRSEVKMVNHLYNLRLEKSNDTSLNAILDEIKGNLNTKDSTKFIDLFNKLSSYLESQYGYKIEARKIEDLDGEELKRDPGKFNLFEILGWLGSICLALCGVPRAIMSYKDRHSHGISWGFLILWAFGELFALAYVYDKLDLPLLLNYAVNILIVGVILYFKVRPEVDPE